MDLRRVCIHEAGHFYLAFKYRPARAVSICISKQVQIDSQTGDEYVSVGGAVTLEPRDGLPKVAVTIRAAGLAAESLVYNESLDDLMQNPATRLSLKTDMDNAKLDLTKGGIHATSEQEFVSDYWRVGFYDALGVLKHGQDKLECIADHCFGNLDRTILKAELVEKCLL